MRFLVCLLLLAGCEAPHEIVRVCFDYPGRDSYCGTGFFVEPDKLVTELHLLEHADNPELEVVAPGINETTKDLRLIPGTEILVALFSHNIIDGEPSASICPDVIPDAATSAVGVLGRWWDAQSVEGELFKHTDEWLWSSHSVPQGYSGGPLIDMDRDCYLGTINGRGNTVGFTRSSNLTTVRDQIYAIE